MRASILLTLLLLAGCDDGSSPRPPQTTAPATATTAHPLPKGDPAEGLRVATRVGCNGCHGHDASGKVFVEDEQQGRIVAPNLTERRDLYDDAALAALLHHGRTHDGHVPWGMPIQMLQHLSQREVDDIIAWLRSLPHRPNPELPPGQWSDELSRAIADGSHPWLADTKADPGNQPPAAPPTETVALGRHLALTSCGECHGWDLNGFEGDDTPPLIVAKAYTPEQFRRLLRTGELATGGRSATGMMSEVAQARFSSMTDREIDALKRYLDSR